MTATPAVVQLRAPRGGAGGVGRGGGSGQPTPPPVAGVGRGAGRTRRRGDAGQGGGSFSAWPVLRLAAATLAMLLLLRLAPRPAREELGEGELGELALEAGGVDEEARLLRETYGNQHAGISSFAERLSRGEIDRPQEDAAATNGSQAAVGGAAPWRPGDPMVRAEAHMAAPRLWDGLDMMALPVPAQPFREGTGQSRMLVDLIR
eukprot:jgi/Tetstr1/459407/TSEL_004785.t1